MRLLGEFSEAALSGKPLNKAGLLFIGGAIQAWLSQGGSLETDYLKVTAPAGSHHTPAYVWQTLCEDSSSRGAQSEDDAGTVSLSTEGDI